MCGLSAVIFCRRVALGHWGNVTKRMEGNRELNVYFFDAFRCQATTTATPRKTSLRLCILRPFILLRDVATIPTPLFV